MSQQHNPENKKCNINQPMRAGIDCTLCTCPSQSKQSQGVTPSGENPYQGKFPNHFPLNPRCPLTIGILKCSCPPQQSQGGECGVGISSPPPIYYSNKRSECCNEPAVLCDLSPQGYFCGGVDGCGKPCETVPPREEKLYLGDDDFRGCPVPADNKDEGKCDSVVQKFWKMLEDNQFIESVNSVTYQVEQYPPAIVDMEAVVKISGEFDKYAIDEFVAQEIAQAEKRGAVAEGRRIWEEAIEKAQMFSELEVAGYAQGKIISLARLSAIINHTEA